jgi:hypothetical protein
MDWIIILPTYKIIVQQDAPWSVNPDEEKTMKAIQAINTMLYEIERTMKAEALSETE